MTGFDLSTISNATIGDKQIDTIYYESHPIWCHETLDLIPIVVPSNGGIVRTWQNSLATTGNATFLMKSKANTNLSHVNLTYSASNPKVLANRLDNFGYMMYRFAGYDYWPGGSTMAPYSENLTFGLGGQTLTTRFIGQIDEDNVIFNDGLYVSKIIKIPSCGGSGSATVKFFPYNFNDEFYGMSEFDINLFDYTDTGHTDGQVLYLWNSSSSSFYNSNSSRTIQLANTMFSSFGVSVTGLEGTISYTATQNLTDDFVDTAFVVGDIMMIHFIQEPSSNNRIYYGETIDSYYWPNYLINSLGSEILGEDARTFTFKKLWHLLYPAALENTYSITTEGTCNLDSNTYTWDGKSFKHYTNYANSKMTFTKL